VTVEVEATSVGLSEVLTLQVADASTGDWLGVERVASERLDGRWTKSTFAGRLQVPRAAIASIALERILEESRPDLEITEVALYVDGQRTTMVKEGQPFTLSVGLDAHRRVARADVGVKVVRTDGVYIFWQSSGQVGQNLFDLEGEYEVRFNIDPNLFGSGEYGVTIDVANGFDIEQNFPYSEMYDRRVNAFQFTVERVWKILDLGPLNYLFPVEVRRRSAGEGTDVAGHLTGRRG
jgi:lipopolysaccharide transport system ATP-binding protein